MIDKEQVYDKRIHPIMAELIRICEEEEIPMFATFQYADQCFCTSALVNDGTHPLIDHHRALDQCSQGNGVNVDKYMFWVAKKVKEEGRGHSSIFLHQAGVSIASEED